MTERISYQQLKDMGGLEALLKGRSGPRRRLRLCVDGLPSEEQEQLDLAGYLNDLKLEWGKTGKILVWNHNPHGGKRPKGEGGKLAAAGASKGVPDNYIYSVPPLAPEARGVAIELKRAHKGVTSDDQKQWLDDLDACGWITQVCYGAKEAIQFLKSLGF